MCGSIVLLGYAGPHLWSSAGQASVVEKDGSAATAAVYRSKGGDVLIAVTGEPAENYIFSPANGAVGIPNGNQFALIPYYAFSKDVPVPVVYSKGQPGAEKAMDITMDANKLIFVTLHGRTVTLDLNALNIRVLKPDPHSRDITL